MEDQWPSWHIHVVNSDVKPFSSISFSSNVSSIVIKHNVPSSTKPWPSISLSHSWKKTEFDCLKLVVSHLLFSTLNRDANVYKVRHYKIHTVASTIVGKPYSLELAKWNNHKRERILQPYYKIIIPTMTTMPSYGYFFDEAFIY